MTLVGCINVLRNAAVSDMTPEQRIEFESQMKSLRKDDIMTEINLLLEDADVKVYRTDDNGDITVRSDGKSLSFETSK